VARYCKTMVAAETSMNPPLLAQATAFEDRLGLTPKAMRLLLWEIVVDEMAAKRRAPKAARGRVKAVN
jgi:hypothetical protein